MDRRRILIAGIGASLVIAMWEMIVEAVIPGGAGFFGTPVAIGATIVRDLQGSANPIPFNVVALILGLMGHMMNSVILAVIFALIVTRLAPSAAGTIGLGMAWGVAVFAMMWFVVAPAINPLLLNLNAAVFLVGHLMWGAALGFIWTRYGSASSEPSFAR